MYDVYVIHRRQRSALLSITTFQRSTVGNWEIQIVYVVIGYCVDTSKRIMRTVSQSDTIMLSLQNYVGDRKS